MEELGPDDEGFAEGDSPDDDVMETNLAAEGDDELLNGPRATVYYHVPVSPTEVEEQGVDFTKEEVEEMMKSEPYQKKLATCHLYVLTIFNVINACVDPEGGGMGFLINTGPDPLENHKLPSQHSMLGHHWPASKAPLK